MSTAADTPAPLMLSVSGARGIVGRSMTPTVAAEFAAAFGGFVVENASSGAPPMICLGRDSRPSGEMLAAAVTAGLLSRGLRVVDLGIVATPSVGVMIEHHRAAGGMVVTASHNPSPWNGLKCLTGEGSAPPAEDAARIIERFQRPDAAIDPPSAYPPVTRDDTAHDRHVERVLETVDPEPIRRRGIRVLLDSVNGAGGPAGRRLLERLGCTVVHDHAETTGAFAHPPEPTAENLAETAAQTRAEGCDVGFAQDPDADRLAIIDETGRYIGEEYTLALAVTQELERHGHGTIVVNLSTSRMVDDIAAAHPGSTVIRTPVGEANVVLEVRRAKLIGGEGNGGVIVPAVCHVRDSLASMALVLSLMARRDAALSAIVDGLPRYEMVKHAIDLDAPGGADDFRRTIIPRVAEAYAGAHVDTADGVRIDLDDGWVHLRPSNTEPIVRVISEAATSERARALVEEMKRRLSD